MIGTQDSLEGEQGSIMKTYDKFYNRVGKRLIGLALSIPLIIVMLPFYLIISIAIVLDDGFPIFYRPLRGGYRNRDFRITKFRTMVKNADKIGGSTTADHDPRITKVGRLPWHHELCRPQA